MDRPSRDWDYRRIQGRRVCGVPKLLEQQNRLHLWIAETPNRETKPYNRERRNGDLREL